MFINALIRVCEPAPSTLDQTKRPAAGDSSAARQPRETNVSLLEVGTYMYCILDTPWETETRLWNINDSPPGHPDMRDPSMDTMSGRPLTSKSCQHTWSLLKSTHTAKPWRTCPSHYLPVVV